MTHPQAHHPPTEDPAEVEGSVGGSQPALGRRLRELRMRRGLSQTAVAGDKVSPSAISLLESGHREPTKRTLAYLAQQLGCTVEYLRDGVEPTTSATLRLTLMRGELAVLVGDAEAARAELAAVAPEDLERFMGVHVQATLLHARIAELSGDPVTAVELLEGLVTAVTPPADAEGAQRTTEAAVPSPIDNHDSDFLCAAPVAFGLLARCHRSLGQPDRAGTAARQGLARLASLGLEDSACGVELRVELLRSLDALNAPAAQEVARAVMTPAQVDTPARIRTHLAEAALARERGEITGALLIVESALTTALADAALLTGLRARAVAALSLLGRGDSGEDVLSTLRRCGSELGQRGDGVTAGQCDAALAGVALERGDTGAAQDLARSALDSLAGSGEVLAQARTRLILGRARAQDGDGAGAQEEASQALKLLDTIGAGRETAEAWREAGELLQQTGDAGRALDAFRQALAAAGIGAP